MRQRIEIYWQREYEDRLPEVMETVRRHFPMLEPVRAEERRPKVTAYDPSRYQYDAAELLRGIPGEGLCLYLVKGDLYYPGYRYLYGAAAEGMAVVSDFRPDTEEGFRKEICHEIGHALGLPHCRKDCVMHVARSERELEHKSGEFCSHCRKMLERPAGLRKNKRVGIEEVNVS